MEDKINLYEIVKILKKRLLLITLSFLITVAITGVISYFFMTPKYDASTQILINHKVMQGQQLNSQDIETNLQLINTYTVIIKSPVVLSKAIDNLKLNTTTDLLMKKISVSSEQNSQVVTISVEDPSQKKAVIIANTIAEVFQEQISVLMKVDNVTILSPAVEKPKKKPFKPNISLNLAIATLFGILLGVGITFLMEYLDTTVTTEQDLQEIMNFPLLGLISPISTKSPQYSNKSKRGL